MKQLFCGFMIVVQTIVLDVNVSGWLLPIQTLFYVGDGFGARIKILNRLLQSDRAENRNFDQKTAEYLSSPPLKVGQRSSSSDSALGINIV